MFCCTLLYVHSSIAIILLGKRELVALLNLSSWCLVMVERLFLAVPRGCLQFVIVVFPDHTELLFLLSFMHFLFYLLDINISFVLSIFIIIPFSRQHILIKFKECCRLFSILSLSKPILYIVVSSAYKYTDRIESQINRGESFINLKSNRGPKMDPCYDYLKTSVLFFNMF